MHSSIPLCGLSTGKHRNGLTNTYKLYVHIYRKGVIFIYSIISYCIILNNKKKLNGLLRRSVSLILCNLDGTKEEEKKEARTIGHTNTKYSDTIIINDSTSASAKIPFRSESF